MYQINYAKTRKYFFPKNHGKIILVTLFVCAISIMWASNTYDKALPIIISLISAGISIFLLKETLDRGNLNDVNEEIAKIKECILDEALNELGIDKEQCNKIPPVIMCAPYYVDCFESFAYRKDSRTPSNWQIIVLLFSEEQVYYFQYIFSLITDANAKNSAEYFYKDIVGFNMNSTSDNVTYKENGKDVVAPISYQAFILKTSGGDAFKVSINNEDTQKIQGMRNLLREKKTATV